MWKLAGIAIGTLLIAVAFASSLSGGVDISYLTRVQGSKTVLHIVSGVVFFVVANYLLNLLVVGLPASRLGPTALPSVAIGLVWLTILGQVFDRISAVLAGFGAAPLARAVGASGDGAWWLSLLALNWVLSGLGVVALAFLFLRRRWGVTKRASWVLALTAGVFTNPAWAFALWFT